MMISSLIYFYHHHHRIINGLLSQLSLGSFSLLMSHTGHLLSFSRAKIIKGRCKKKHWNFWASKCSKTFRDVKKIVSLCLQLGNPHMDETFYSWELWDFWGKFCATFLPSQLAKSAGQKSRGGPAQNNYKKCSF